MPNFVANDPITTKDNPITIDNPTGRQALVLKGSSNRITIAYENPGGDLTLTIPVPGNNATFVVEDHPQTLKKKTLDSAKVLTGLFDRNSNEWIRQIDPPATPVNYLEVGNSAAGNPVIIRAEGNDGNVGINLATKNQGDVLIQGTAFIRVAVGGTLTLQTGFSLNSLTLSGAATFSGQVSFTEGTAPIISATIGPSATQQHTLPASASGTLCLIAATQTLTNKTIGASTISGLMTFNDAVNIAVNATTGTKIGTATTQKLGFYNATPVVQAAAITSIPAGGTGTAAGGWDTAANRDTAITSIGSILTALRNLGLIAT